MRLYAACGIAVDERAAFAARQLVSGQYLCPDDDLALALFRAAVERAHPGHTLRDVRMDAVPGELVRRASAALSDDGNPD